MNEVWGRCAEEVSLDLTGSFWTNLLPRVKNEATIKVFASQASEESDWETTAYGLSKRLVSRSRFACKPRFAGACRFAGRVCGLAAGDGQCSVTGLVAEWSCSGLQIRVRRFDSDPGLQPARLRGVMPQPRDVPARMAKLVDARDLKSVLSSPFCLNYRARRSIVTTVCEHPRCRFIAWLDG